MVHLVNAALASRAVMCPRWLYALALLAKPSSRLVESLRVILRRIHVVFGCCLPFNAARISSGRSVVGSADKSDQALKADDVKHA
jgi:hypothetical protein